MFNIDWESHSDTVRFTDIDLTVENADLAKGSYLIYDLRAYDLKTKQVSSFGFAIMPLLANFQQRHYFNSGYHVLPVYKGPVPLELYKKPLTGFSETFQQTEEILQTVYKMTERGELEVTSSMVMVKAVDG